MSCYVLMGVSGCGKSSVGAALSERCGIASVDGDDLHPSSNIAKMASGIALTDVDRAPWLRDVGRRMAQQEGPIVIGCSALKRIYRDWIRREVPQAVYFLHLHASRDVLRRRVAERSDHFMPPALLDSQFADLEYLDSDELGTQIDIARPFQEVVAQTETYVRGTLL